MIGDAHAPGSTPLDPDEAAGLIPGHIATQRELNEWEQTNILTASRWAAASAPGDILEQGFLRELHRRMFDETWKWAGHYRKSDKSIGVDWTQITERTERLLGDVRYQVEHASWPPAEIAIRFHHRLVSIHLFPNGNGRHARLCADILVSRLGAPALTWGRIDFVDAGAVRTRYIESLQAADRGDYGPIIAFAQS